MKKDIYAEATAKIVAELEKGFAPWVKPWSSKDFGGGMPYNAATGRAYSGCNIVFLAMAGMSFPVPGWLTFKQAKDLGGNVRKGEHGTKVYLMKPMTRQDEKNPDKTKPFFMMREYTVFNVGQCENLPTKIYNPEPRKPVNEDARIQLADDFVKATGAVIVHDARAVYMPGPDKVGMPPFEAFKSAANYYSVLFHEMGHWTGAKHRLDRDLSGRFGNEKYAAEELIAELTSAFLSAEFELDGDIRHAGYIASWIKLLKADSRAIFTAASKAQAAANFMRGIVLAEPAAEADGPEALAA